MRYLYEYRLALIIILWVAFALPWLISKFQTVSATWATPTLAKEIALVDGSFVFLAQSRDTLLRPSEKLSFRRTPARRFVFEACYETYFGGVEVMDKPFAFGVRIPLGFMPVLASMPLALIGGHAAWGRWKSKEGVCRTCGYDLRATPDRCPECGTVFLPAGCQ